MNSCFVSIPVANLFLHPEEKSIATQTIYGQSLECLEGVNYKGEKWYRVSFREDSFRGYIRASDVISGFSFSDRMYKTSSLQTHIYSFNDTVPSPPILELPMGSCIKLLHPDFSSLETRWYETELLDGRRAWVQRGDIEERGEIFIKEAEKLIEYSKKFLGRPYLWGGKSSFAYDCSGFIQMLASKAGVSLPRDSKDQCSSNLLLSVERGDLKACDLLFFGTDRVSHAGMYIGDGAFIHSGVRNHRPYIHIDTFDESDYPFLCARRMLFNGLRHP